MNRDFEDLGGIDPYELLGVAGNADTADINRAYRRLALRTHPDKGGDEELLKRLNLAREVLLDPARRTEMNRRLRQRRDADDEIVEEMPTQESKPQATPYEDKFDWTCGTGPSPRQAPRTQDAAPQREPQPHAAPREDQFGWMYGTGLSPLRTSRAEDSASRRQPVHGYLAQQGYPYRARLNRLAIASLVMAYACYPVGLFMAITALGQVRSRHERGVGLAWMAIGSGWILLALCAMAVGTGLI